MLQSYTEIPEYLKILTKCGKNVQNYFKCLRSLFDFLRKRNSHQQS
jgi:hypothetical protein